MLTLERVLSVCELLTPPQRRRACRLAGLDPEDVRREVPAARALVVWAADALQLMPLADGDARWAVLEELAPLVLAYGEHLGKALEGRDPAAAAGKLPQAHAGLGDRRYAAFTGHAKVFDAKEARWLDGVGAAAGCFERINYDLTGLALARLRACAGEGKET